MTYDASTAKRKGERNAINRLLSLIFGLAVLAGLESCEQGIMHTETHQVPGAAWSMSDTVSFRFAAPDTVNLYDIILYLRNTTDYPKQNIYLFIDTWFPERILLKDTLEFRLSDPEGHWLGSGRGYYRENHILYRFNTRFGQAGEYRMNIIHAMRSDTLIGVDELGLIIRRTKYKAGNDKE